MCNQIVTVVQDSLYRILSCICLNSSVYFTLCIYANHYQGKNMKVSDEKIIELRLDFIKTWVTFLLAVVAGEAALLQSPSVSSPGAKLAFFISIGCLVIACVFSLGASESVINRHYIPPSKINRFVNFMYRFSPKSLESEWGFSSLSSCFIAGGLVSFVFGLYRLLPNA